MAQPLSEVFRDCRCKVAHNHPSGVPEPSRADELLTAALKQALAGSGEQGQERRQVYDPRRGGRSTIQEVQMSVALRDQYGSSPNVAVNSFR
jgi:hypothetical protein